MSINIAIDGPAGAGKSTIAKAVAKQLGYIYVDTGAMYRAMALYFIKENLPLDDEALIGEKVVHADVSIRYENGEQQVILNGENVTGLLRTEEIGNAASVTSAYPKVREHILSLQRQLAEAENVIMDGRDIGTCVLPNAQIKIFLTASVETRAKRRYLELTQKGQQPDLEKIKEDIKERDLRDSTRAASPLKQAEDAVLVDSSDLGIAEVVDEILRITKERI